MKIFYLGGGVLPSQSANSVHIMHMCNALANNGNEVVLFARPGKDSVSDIYDHYGVGHGFRITPGRSVPLRFIGRPSYSLLAACQIRRNLPADLLYARDSLTLAAVAHLGVPFVFEAHVIPTGPLRVIEQYLFRCRAFRRLVVISSALREDYLRYFPSLNATDITVAHDAALLPDNHVTPPVELVGGTAGDGLQIGYVGALYPGRGIEIILALGKRLPEHNFHVAGGSEKDLAHWRQAASGCSNLHLHGFLPPGHCNGFRQSMDVLLAPYQRRTYTSQKRAETSRWMSPMKAFEYMAAGKAIVVSDLPVLREVFQHGQNCLLIPPDNVDAWEGAIRRLVDPALRQMLGNGARDQLIAQHTWEQRARIVLSKLEQNIEQMRGNH